jgi:mRNA interferase MazF
MTVHRGDIVLLAFPFSGGTGTKVRPAIVVQVDRNNERLKNTIVAMITSTTGLADREATQLLIDVNTPEGKLSGLLHTSAVKCENVFTVEQRLVVKTIGTLPALALRQVDHCLRQSLGLVNDHAS